MLEFTILKDFKCNINPPKTSIVKEEVSHPSILNSIKCNCDGTVIVNPSVSSCGWIFRNRNALFLGCFGEGMGIGNSTILPSYQVS